MLGMVRAGIVVFPLSPRFSANVLGYLIATNNVQHILVSTETHIGHIAQAAIKEANKFNPSVSAQLFPMPTFESLYGVDCPMVRLPARVVDMSATSFIVHSSCVYK
jgi:acyl-CoA synthetase (AMP-forming)/AMP-acid ligase II